MDVMDLENSLWLIEIVLGLALLAAGNWALKKLVHQYCQKQAGWLGKLDQIIFAPMRFILWAFGIAYVLSVLSHHFGLVKSEEFFHHGRNACIVFALAWSAMRWKKKMQEQLLHRHDPGNVQIGFKLFTAMVAVLTALVTLQIFGVNILPLLAFGGIGAAAVGFAAKDLIGNFFGGFMLFIDRPFVEGDEIYIYKEEIEGYVEKIGWHMTIVRDMNKCPVYLPNAIFNHSYVVNRSRMSHRLIEETLDIRYEDVEEVPALTDYLRRTLASFTEIDASLPLLVGVKTLGDYALNIHLKMHTFVTREADYVRTREEILLRIYAILEERGIEMPLPTHAISLLPTLQESATSLSSH